MKYKYKSLFDVWQVSCKKYSDLIAFSDNKEKVQITYKQAFKELCFLAQEFQTLGLKKYDHVCLFAGNSPRWLIIEQAIITLGAVCVSKNSEINIKELDFVFNNSDSIALITDKMEIINHFIDSENFRENVKFVLYIGDENAKYPPPNEFSKIYNLSDILKGLTDETPIKTDWEEEPFDTAYINYTSGTSSSPKGAMLPNIGMSYVVEELQKFNDIKEGKTFVVTFPLSSAGGKSFNLLCFSQGCRVMYTPYKEFYEVIDKYKPEYLHCAPKIMQTMHEKLMNAVKEKGFIFQHAYNIAFSISKLIQTLERRCNVCAKILKPFKNFLDKKIYKQIRNTLLTDETIVFVGSAHLAKPLEDYFDIIGIPLVQHYGLTETTGLAVSNTLESQKKHPYTVGVAFEGTTIRIINPETHKEMKNGEVGLITLGGVEILKEYYKNEEATKKAILEEHFLNTGDLGYVDKEGYLVVLSRYDDVIVMSNGYNIYTPLLENEAKDSEFINQLVIAGHGKPYLTAVIVLNNVEYQSWCEKNSISTIDANRNDKFKTFLIENLNEKIKRKNDWKYYEKLKKVYFTSEPFTVENGLLTGTLKVKYQKVINTYKKEIEKLYEEK